MYTGFIEEALHGFRLLAARFTKTGKLAGAVRCVAFFGLVLRRARLLPYNGVPGTKGTSALSKIWSCAPNVSEPFLYTLLRTHTPLLI